MSADTPASDLQVKDEEGVVDKKVKEHITNLREQIDDDERRLYVELPATREEFDRHQADVYWGVSIRQYLRAIKRLWNDDNDTPGVQRVGYYWQEKDIATVDLYPPPTDGYDLRPVYVGEVTERQFIRQHNLPRGVELPEPEQETFQGLADVLETDAIRAQWTMTTSERGAPGEVERVTFRVERPVPKHVLERTVEVADNFLQQAGVGFETKAPDYMGGDEPGL